MIKAFLPAILSLFYFTSFAQVERVEPLNWWVGMKNPKVELMFYGKGIATAEVMLTDYAGVTWDKPYKSNSPNYKFITIRIASEAKPGELIFNFKQGKKKFSYKYKLLARERDAATIQGFDNSDLIYLLMPDRFSNGDEKNDVVPTMNQKTMNRAEMYERHGGDIQGIINHLDYLKDLGATAIWSCPLLTNDQPAWSYHGYANTEFYQIDPRYGTNELYKQYVSAAHGKGLKIIMDFVFNHCGNECWWFKDLPDSNWVHWFPEFTRSNYRPNALMDPYSSELDKKLCSNGWFDKHMPDLNQQNEMLANYLTQCIIWWVEYAGIDGYRFDTYPYPDNDFSANAVKALKEEYPNIGVLGETWEQSVPSVAYWQENSPLRHDGKNSYLPSLTDFMLYFAIKDGLKENFGWNTGLARVYYTLSQDHLYADANKNVTFLDNHDIGRIYSELGEDIVKWKKAIVMLMTLRGIPSIYYGTEILLPGLSNPDGHVRKDFPGGWKADTINKFTEAGRVGKDKEAFDFLKNLANWRKTSEPITKGKLMQFIPDDNTWVYCRYTDNACVMVLQNTSDKERKLDGKRFKERTSGFTKGKNILDGSIVNDLNSFTLAPNSVMVLELQP